MKFMSGDEYVGNFCENVPNGEGNFFYENGDSETVVMEGGARHGLSRYKSMDDSVEEVMFWEGMPEGPSKLIYPDGSYEERKYSAGEKNGPAVLKSANGDTYSFEYK